MGEVLTGKRFNRVAEVVGALDNFVLCKYIVGSFNFFKEFKVSNTGVTCSGNFAPTVIGHALDDGVGRVA